VALRQERRADRRLRRRDGRDEGAPRARPGRDDRRRHAGAPARPPRTRRARPVALGRGARRGRRDARHGLPRGARGNPRRHPDGRRTMLFSATMPRPIVALAKRYQNDALRISTVDDNRGHGDIAYQAVAVAPSDIEHAVINILASTRPRPRSCSAPRATMSAICRTRSTSAASRSSRCRASIARPSATTRCRRCATAGPRLRRDRRRRARHRPAQPQPGRPRRDAARCRGAPAPLGPHRPRGQEGHGGADRPLSAPPPGRDDAQGRADRGRVDRHPDPRRHPRRRP
jgi:hypothetical protein